MSAGNQAKKILKIIDYYGMIKCRYCGIQLKFMGSIGIPNRGTIDHVKPRKLGGGEELGNKAFACEPCNNKKGCKLL